MGGTLLVMGKSILLPEGGFWRQTPLKYAVSFRVAPQGAAYLVWKGRELILL
jgi:hypothetical protein